MEFNSSVHKHMHKCGQSGVFPRRMLLNYQSLFFQQEIVLKKRKSGEQCSATWFID